MKRRYIWILIAAMLTLACAVPAAGSRIVSAITATPVGAAERAVLNETAGTLPDPEDDSRATLDAFVLKKGETEIPADGTVYPITEAGEYTLSGLLSEGQIVIYIGDDDEVTLILSNASLSSSTGAPILVKNAGEVTVKAEKGTYNTVTDQRTGSADGTEDDAAIYAPCDLKLTGSGTLIVSTAFDNGIKSKDDLSVKNVTLKVSARGNALKGNDSVTISSGSLILISAASDGIKTDNSGLSSKDRQRGTVTIAGGQTDIYAARDGISAAYDVTVCEEETCVLNIFTGSYAGAAGGTAGSWLIVPSSLYSEDLDFYAYFYNSDTASGIYEKCVFTRTIYSGSAAYYGLRFDAPEGYENVRFMITGSGETPNEETMKASTSGETLNAAMNGYVVTSVSGGLISGDWTQIAGGGEPSESEESAKGIKAENAITVSGGTVTVRTADDGVHANGGTELDSGAKGLGSVTISGGFVTIAADDDGLHADGALSVSGGTVRIEQSHEGIEANVIKLSGGELYVYGEEDGLNAVKGSEEPVICIDGGNAEIRTASGDTDAIDSNGSFVMTGGTVLVLGGSNIGGVAGSVDVDGTVTVTGGTIVALGGICETPQSGSVNTFISNGTAFSAGEYHIADDSGTTIFSFTLNGSYMSCWIASDVFQIGGSYVVEKDGSSFLSWTQSAATEGSAGGFSGFGGFGEGGFPGNGENGNFSFPENGEGSSSGGDGNFSFPGNGENGNFSFPGNGEGSSSGGDGSFSFPGNGENGNFSFPGNGEGSSSGGDGNFSFPGNGDSGNFSFPENGEESSFGGDGDFSFPGNDGNGSSGSSDGIVGV